METRNEDKDKAMIENQDHREIRIHRRSKQSNQPTQGQEKIDQGMVNSNTAVGARTQGSAQGVYLWSRPCCRPCPNCVTTAMSEAGRRTPPARQCCLFVTIYYPPPHRPHTPRFSAFSRRNSAEIAAGVYGKMRLNLPTLVALYLWSGSGG